MIGFGKAAIKLRDGIWSNSSNGSDDDVLSTLLGAEALAEIDPFDRVQLTETIRVCRSSRSMSEAGRSLFSASRERKSSPNDADRLRKYLTRFGLDWNAVTVS